MRSYVFGFIGLAVFYAAFAMGADKVIPLTDILPDLNVLDMRNALQDDHPMLDGEFQDTQPLGSSWCRSGAWSYHITIHTPLNNLDLDLKKDNSLAVHAELGNVDGHADGTLRSRETFCQKVGVGTGFGADGVQIAARVTFRGDPSDFSNAVVRVESTHLDRIHFASWIPDFVSDSLTDLTNRGLEYLWRTRLGDWIGDYVAKKLKNGIPELRS